MNAFLQLGTIGSETTLSDIERTFDEDKEVIERSKRLSSGKMVRDIICWKKVFMISWKWLAHTSSETPDAGAGANEVETEVEKDGPLSFKITKPGTGTDDYTVFVTGFSKKLTKREESVLYYDVSLTLEEQ